LVASSGTATTYTLDSYMVQGTQHAVPGPLVGLYT
jgi:hypothetical protein